jgi:RNA recognition motif-containing protein
MEKNEEIAIDSGNNTSQEKDGSERKSGPAKFSVKISNIPSSFTVEEYKNFLSEKFGACKKHYLALNRKTKTCRGFGFVHVKTKDDADRCVSVFNDMKLPNGEDAPLKAEYEQVKMRRRRFGRTKSGAGDEQSADEGGDTPKPRQRRRGRRPAPKDANDGEIAENGNENAKPRMRRQRQRPAVFSVQFKGLPKTMDEKKFEELVKEFGPTKKRFISKEKTTGECKGFGFVHYRSKSVAEKAIEGLNGKVVEEAELAVEWSKREKSDKTKIYISNLPESAEENDVQELVKDLGTHERIYVAKDKTSGLGKGYAFVDFQNHEDAEKAIETLNGKKHGDAELKVDWAKLKLRRRRRPFYRSRKSESGQDDSKKKSSEIEADLKKMVDNITI